MQTFGIAFRLSDAILGLTFLAWGNSLGGEYLLNLLFIHNQQSLFSHSSLRARVKNARAKTWARDSFDSQCFFLPVFAAALPSSFFSYALRTKSKEELLIDLS